MATAKRNAATPIVLEIFFSYSHQDEKLRDQLDKHLSVLKSQGVTVHWHDRKISGGREWAGEIDQHLNTADIVLLLVSPNFVASHYCYHVEMPRAMERHEAKEARVVPILLRDVDWRGTPFAKLNPLPTNFKAVSSWSNRDKAFTNIAVGVRRVAEELREGGAGVDARAIGPTAASSPAGTSPSLGVAPRLRDADQARREAAAAAKSKGLPPIWNVPHLPNPNFTGREDLLKKLHESLSSGELAALTQAMVGLGGVGKTQTAVEYCYRHAADYELVWWISSEKPGKLASDFAALAEPLNLPEKHDKDQRVVVQAVREALSRRGRWLLVFDNATGPDDIKGYLPKAKTGHVFVTSRNPAFGGVAQPLKVQVMSKPEAVEFLLKRVQGGDEKDAAALAKELGCLPLALEQAGAYIEEHGSAFAGYLKLFREHQKEILARAEPPVGYEATIATTWELSFAEVEKKSAAAAQLMNLCAFLAPDDIGREMLRGGAEFLPEPLAKAVGDDLQWDDAVGALRRYSLVEVQDGAISVHRLVQAVVRERLDQAGLVWAGAAIRIGNATFPSAATNARTWGPCSLLLPHALAAAEHGERLKVALEAAGGLLVHVGLYLWARADFTAARLAFERALGIDEAVYGHDHPKVATDVTHLGVVLSELGDLVSARTHCERALKIDERVRPLDKGCISRDVCNLGCVLEELGDFAGARDNYERVLKIDEAEGGRGHHLAQDLNNFGGVLRKLGDLQGALAHCRRALERDEADWGASHEFVARDANSLGRVLGDLGDFGGARVLFERAISINEAIYGPGHQKVAVCVNNLGDVLRKTGDLRGARANIERALMIDEVICGLDHPNVARDVSNLGLVLQELGDLAGARVRYERALKIFERSLGRDHPKTQTVRRNLESLGQ